MAKQIDKRKKHTVSVEYAPRLVTATCACGASFDVIACKDIRVDVCSQCHPFFTGDSHFVDAEGRIEKFKKKYQQVS